MDLSVWVILSILVSIVFGYLLKINVGLFGMIFAYLFGVFGLGLTPGAVTGTFVLPLFFTIFTIIFFYGFAINNGTLELISKKVVNVFKRWPWAIPLICYFLCCFMSGIGPGPWAVFAFMSPLVFQIAKDIKMNNLIAAEAIIGGGVAGAITPVGAVGGICKNLISLAGYPERAAEYTHALFINTFVGFTILFIIVYILFKGYKVKALQVETKPFNPVQKKTLWLIIAMLSLSIIPAVCSKLLPENATIQLIAKAADVNYISLIGVIFAVFLKIGSEKDAMNRVPWGTIITLCGMGMLVNIAIQAGAVKLMADVINSTISSPTFAYILFTVGSGIMSMFTSTFGVVMPTLYPLVPSVVSSLGAEPTVLFSVITLGAATGVSPLASGGIVLAGIRDEEEKLKVYNQLFLLAFISIPIIFVLAISGVFV